MPQNQMPDNWEPPVPAWSADFDSINPVTMVTYGVQSSNGEEHEFLCRFSAATAETGAPDHVEYGSFADPAGVKNHMAICYWRDGAASANWRENSSFSQWLQSDDRLTGEPGFWVEALTLPLDRFETLFSSENPAGAATLTNNSMTGPIREHGYWGGMRDRIPLSDRDSLSGSTSESECSGDARGRRIRIAAPENLCLIHSAQNWAECEEGELATYLEDVQPVLTEGMQFLSDNSDETGCISCRYVTEHDGTGNELPRSFGYAWFTSMSHLEAWAKSHPTHLKIFGEFHKMVEKHNFDIKLKLWHEVAVVGEGGGVFDYINCHPKTGLLPTL